MEIKTALVVDDSKSARFSLKKLLQKQDIKCDFAESAGDALNHLESNKPDVIFMDHLMPGMDGFEATKAIKGNLDTKDIPIIMCTSKEGTEYAEQAIATGAVGILPKPAPAATLSAIIKQLQSATVATDTASGAPAQPNSVNQRVVEGIVKNIVDTQLNDIMRKALEDTVANEVKLHIDGIMISTRETLKDDVKRALESELNTTTQQICTKITTEIIELQFEELKGNLTNSLKEKLTAQESVISQAKELSPELIEETKKIAQFTAAHTAGETAKTAAEEVSRNIAQDITQEELHNLKSELTEEFSEQIKSATSTAKYIAIAGMMLGLSAITLFVLKM